MKPCRNNRKQIAWLALNELETEKAHALRHHLESCEGCRQYWEEISMTAEKLKFEVVPSAIQASESMHRTVMRAVRAVPRLSATASLSNSLRAWLLNWRVAVPVAAATIAVLVVVSVLMGPEPTRPPPPAVSEVVSVPKTRSDPAPTLSNYQMVANESLEELDDLLTRQANRAPAASTTYTASMLATENAAQ